MSGTLISVGNPHPMWLPQCDPGAVFDDDIGMFVVGLPHVSSVTVEEFQGPGRLGYMRHRSIIVLSLILGEVIDFSVPYHASLVERCSPITDFGPGEHRLLQFCLVDASSGETLAMRASTVNSHLSGLLAKAFHEQVANPIAKADFITDTESWNDTYPTGRSARQASTFSRLGG